MVKSAEHWSNFSPSLAMLTYPNNGKIPKWDKKLNKHTNKIVKKNLLHGLYPYNTINVRCKCSTFFMASLIAMQCILPLICAFYRGRTKRHMYEVHHCLLVWSIQLLKPAFFFREHKRDCPLRNHRHTDFFVGIECRCDHLPET